MDCFNRDIQRLLKKIEKEHSLIDISRGRNLEKLDALATHFNQVIALHNPHCADAYYVSPRYGELMGSKPGASGYGLSDYNQAMYTAANAAHHTLFIAHFGNAEVEEHRTTYRFITAAGKTLWLTTCSLLIKPGMGYSPFILSLLQSMDIMNPGYDRELPFMPAPDDLKAFIEIIDTMSVRQVMALELIAAGADNDRGADEMNIGYNTFRDYRSEIKAMLGKPYNEKIGLYFFAGKLNKPGK